VDTETLGMDSPPRSRRTEVHKQNLVFAMVDDFRKLRAERHQIGSRQPAFENGELKVIAPPAHHFENVAQALRLTDVVTDDVGVPHDAPVYAGVARLRINVLPKLPLVQRRSAIKTELGYPGAPALGLLE